AQSQSGRERESDRLCTREGLFRYRSALLRIAQEQKRGGEKRHCPNLVVGAESPIRRDRLLVGSAEIDGPLQVKASVNESTHHPERLARKPVTKRRYAGVLMMCSER